MQSLKNTSKILFFILFMGNVLVSCQNSAKQVEVIETNAVEKIETPIDTIHEIIVEKLIPTAFESKIRPNEKLMLGKIYTDTVKFIEFNDGGDLWMATIETKEEIIHLINSEGFQFKQGDEIEIQWKMDSIRYAGDDEFVSYTVYLLAAKSIVTQPSADKNRRILWREFIYNEEYDTDFYSIVLADEYFQNISDPEKAVIAYASTFIGNECVWDGQVDSNRSNLKCKLITALNLGFQCSESHLGFLRHWFRSTDTILQELANCPTMPDGATIQTTFDEMNIAVKGENIFLAFSVNGTNLRESKTWNWQEEHHYELKKDELILINKDVSEKTFGTLIVGEN